MILVIAEHNNQALNVTTKNVISAAQQLAAEIHVLVVGFNCAPVAQSAQKLAGVSKVLCADAVEYKDHLAENLSQLICELANDYSYILAPATTFGKDLLPRVAAKLDLEQISDITAILDNKTFVRPIYAGNALATVTSMQAKQLISVRPTAFPVCDTNQQLATLQNISITIPAKNTKLINFSIAEHGALPDLNSAKIIVAGGRGFASQQKFALLQQLAEVLHAGIGASRAAVDAGFVSNDLQIGQTGKVVAPQLYIAIGISGAIQHVAGIKDSKVIVAINKDPDAPIFEVADYGLVGDLFEILPQLIADLSKNERLRSST